MTDPKTESLGVARIHFPIRALGYGARVGLWLQGCSIYCPGCMSRDTWAEARTRRRVEDLAEEIEAWLPGADGLSITGGEPLDQAGDLASLLARLRGKVCGDIILFTGYSEDALPEGSGGVLAHIDTLVAGPFEAEVPSDVPLLGSANQTLRFLTELGRARYARFCEEARQRPPIDLVLEGEEVWMAGVPRPGDLDRLDQKMKARGLKLTTSAGRLGGRS
jgi:anaerobic ribonucleoside-triphosphate reductase activating protein